MPERKRRIKTYRVRAIGNTNGLAIADGLANEFHPRRQDPRFYEMTFEEHAQELHDQTGTAFVPQAGKVRSRFSPD